MRKHLVFLPLAAGLAVRAAEYTWTGAFSSAMGDPANYADENGAQPPGAPGVSDTIVFSNAVDSVAHPPVNDAGANRFGVIHVKTNGYVLAGADLYYKNINLDPGVTLTNTAPLSWTDSEQSRVALGERAVFVQNGAFGPGPGEFMMQAANGAEFVFNTSVKGMKVRDSNSSDYTATFATAANLYMEMQGTPRIRTTGGGLDFGDGKIKFTGSTIYFGGGGSGNITKSGEFEFDWNRDINVFVEDVVFWGGFFRGETDGNHVLYKRGNGACVMGGNSILSSRGGSNDNGMMVRVSDGTLCVNGGFTTFSRKQNNLEGLRVDAGARLEGVGVFDTRTPDGNGLTNKTANIYGVIAPGCSHGAPQNIAGTFTFIGADFTFRSGSRLEIKAGREAQGRLVLDAAPVTIEGGAALEVIPLDDGAPRGPFVILENTAGLPVNGFFDGLPEGAKAVASANGAARHYRITYFGGNGHDIALIPLPGSTLLLIQ